jgi:hypothetical protein
MVLPYLRCGRIARDSHHPNTLESSPPGLTVESLDVEIVDQVAWEDLQDEEGIGPEATRPAQGDKISGIDLSSLHEINIP